MFTEETTIAELIEAAYVVLAEIEERAAVQCQALDGGVRLAQALFELDCSIDRAADALGVPSGSEIDSRRAHPAGRHFKGRNIAAMAPLLPL